MADLQFFKQDKFDDCYKLANHFEITETFTIPVLHINTLIKEKEQSLQPKDKMDAEELKKIHKK